MSIVPDRERVAEAEAPTLPVAIASAWRGEERRRAIMPFVFVLAMLMAPALASFVRVEAGLLVMGIALSATATLLRGSVGDVPVRFHRVLRILLALNLLLALACFAAAIVRLMVI